MFWKLRTKKVLNELLFILDRVNLTHKCAYDAWKRASENQRILGRIENLVNLLVADRLPVGGRWPDPRLIEHAKLLGPAGYPNPDEWVFLWGHEHETQPKRWLEGRLDSAKMKATAYSPNAHRVYTGRNGVEIRGVTAWLPKPPAPSGELEPGSEA